MKPMSFASIARSVIEIEAQAVSLLAQSINESFEQACQLLLNCQGHIIVTGIGKSGHIAHKIASTFSSTGSPAFFVHTAEANHGDMGMLTKRDVILAISNSGQGAELLHLLPAIKRLQIPLIALTGNPESPLAKHADVILNIQVTKEACPLDLAPTASTTATLVLGDALAIALLEARGFTKQDFAHRHPGGQLGKRLLLRLEDIMLTGEAIPTVQRSTTLRDALLQMTKKKLGFTAIIDPDHHLLGIFTDGDLRRALDNNLNWQSITMAHVMNSPCKTIQSSALAVDALQHMNQHKITSLMIVDENKRLVGVIDMHTLLQYGLS